MPLKNKDQWKKNLRKRANALCRGVLLEAHGRLIRRTPVRTGRAKGNWNVGVGTIDRSTNEDRRQAEALSEGQAVILGRFKAGDRAFITNSLPYIPNLEDGSSKQAPQGMVKVTVAEMKPLVSRVAAAVASGQ